MHFKELSHHYLLSRETGAQELPAAGHRRREAWRGKVAAQGHMADERFGSF